MKYFLIDNFITSDLCNFFIDVIRNNNSPSQVKINSTTEVNQFRTSSTCKLEDIESCKDKTDFVKNLICEYLKQDINYMEKLSGLQYKPGQFYKPHYDFFIPGSETNKTFGQRTWSCIVYLNSVIESGYTYFPNLNLKFKPVKGTFLAWNNFLENGNLNYKTLHEATSPIMQNKYVLTSWFNTKRQSD